MTVPPAMVMAPNQSIILRPSFSDLCTRSCRRERMRRRMAMTPMGRLMKKFLFDEVSKYGGLEMVPYY